MDSLKINIKNIIINKDTIINYKDTIINITNFPNNDYSIYFFLLTFLLILLLIIYYFKKFEITNNFYFSNDTNIKESKNIKTDNIKNIEDAKIFLKNNKIEETNL
ncbi:MAG: hypothetical protein N2Z85_03560 [Patescibacteria group bacterium]|nr:hypothetical protein [Patescibacteria group bacterium]